MSALVQDRADSADDRPADDPSATDQDSDVAVVDLEKREPDVDPVAAGPEPAAADRAPEEFHVAPAPAAGQPAHRLRCPPRVQLPRLVAQLYAITLDAGRGPRRGPGRLRPGLATLGDGQPLARPGRLGAPRRRALDHPQLAVAAARSASAPRPRTGGHRTPHRGHAVGVARAARRRAPGPRADLHGRPPMEEIAAVEQVLVATPAGAAVPRPPPHRPRTLADDLRGPARPVHPVRRARLRRRDAARVSPP